MQLRRRQLFVDAKLQGALLLHVALYWLYCVIALLMLALVWIVFAKRPSTSVDLLEELWGNFGPMLLGSVLILPLVLLDFMRISNRLAGPMLRLRREIKALANGEIPRAVHLRKGDFWLEFAEDWNRAVARHIDHKPSVAPVAAVSQPAEDSTVPGCTDTVSA